MKQWAFLAACVLLVPTPLLAQGGTRGSKVPAVLPIRLSVASQGNEARFVVREQLARAELPNEAVGVTTTVCLPARVVSRARATMPAR